MARPRNKTTTVKTHDLLNLIKVMENNTQAIALIGEKFSADLTAVMEKQIDLQQSAFTSKTTADLVVDIMASLYERGFKLAQEQGESK